MLEFNTLKTPTKHPLLLAVLYQDDLQISSTALEHIHKWINVSKSYVDHHTVRSWQCWHLENDCAFTTRWWTPTTAQSSICHSYAVQHEEVIAETTAPTQMGKKKTGCHHVATGKRWVRTSTREKYEINFFRRPPPTTANSVDAMTLKTCVSLDPQTMGVHTSHHKRS